MQYGRFGFVVAFALTVACGSNGPELPGGTVDDGADATAASDVDSVTDDASPSDGDAVHDDDASAPVWGTAAVVVLTDHGDEPHAAVDVTLTVAEARALVGASTIPVGVIDFSAQLASTIAALPNACGTDWQNATETPIYNCNGTPLGRTFPAPVQASPDARLVRLLTMTPSNTQVDGTSMETWSDIADNIGNGGGFSDFFVAVFGVSSTSPLVSPAACAQAMRSTWLASHPNVGSDAAFAVPLAAALDDLASLAITLGPSGTHPGLLDASATPHAELFSNDAGLVVPATSNVRVGDGVQLGVGAHAFAFLDATTPATLAFSSATVDDTLASPTTSLRFAIYESPTAVAPCVGNACKNNIPGYTPRDIWSAASYTTEAILNSAAYASYRLRDPNPDVVFDWDIFVSTASISVQDTSYGKGWVVTTANIVGFVLEPPAPRYLWEIFDEVAQARMHHDPLVAEGNATIAFTVSNIPVVIDQTMLRDALRTALAASSSELADRAVGDWSTGNDEVDFFYARGTADAPYLYGANGIAFFSSPTCAVDTKVSEALTDAGGVAREALLLATGETTVYTTRAALVYRLVITVPEGPHPSVSVAISERL